MSSANHPRPVVKPLQNQGINNRFERLSLQGMDPFALYEPSNSKGFLESASIPAVQEPMEGFSAFDDAFFPPAESPPSSSPPTSVSPFTTLLPQTKPSYQSTSPSGSQRRYSIKASVCNHHLRYSDTLPWSGTELDFEERYCEGCLRRDRFAKDIASTLELDDLSHLNTPHLDISATGHQGPFMGYSAEVGDQGLSEGVEPTETMVMGGDCVMDDLFEGEYLLDEDEEQVDDVDDALPSSPEFGVSFSPRRL